MIDTIISRHLASGKRLVVPDLGAFIRKDGGELVFVEFLKKDDGVLVDLVSRELGLGESEAREAVAGYVDGVRRAVAGVGRYVIAGVGALGDDPNGILALGAEPVVPVPPVVEPAPEVKAFTLNDLYSGPVAPEPLAPEPAPIPPPVRSFNDIYSAPAPVVSEPAPPPVRSFNDLYAAPEAEPTALNDLYAKPEAEAVQSAAPRPQVQIRRPMPRKKRSRTDVVMIIAIIAAAFAIASMILGMVRNGNPEPVRKPIEVRVDSIPGEEQ